MQQEEIAKDLLSGDDEETQSSADDLTPSVTSHETNDFFPRTLRCKHLDDVFVCLTSLIKKVQPFHQFSFEYLIFCVAQF